MKSSAADRTISMFPEVKSMDSRRVESIEETPQEGARVTMEEDSDRMRDKAFTVQEWSTKAFGRPEATGNEYRVSHKGEHYYLETLAKKPGSPTAYGYAGLMIHERDLYAVTATLVQAVRARQLAVSKNGEKPSAGGPSGKP